MTNAIDRLDRCVRAGVHTRRVSRQQVGQQEGDQRDAEQHRDGVEQPLSDIANHFPTRILARAPTAMAVSFGSKALAEYLSYVYIVPGPAQSKRSTKRKSTAA